MTRSDLLRGIGMFALVVAVVVAGTTAAGTIASDPVEESTQPTAPAFDGESVLPAAVSDDGDVDVPPGTTPKTIVIDTSHGNAVDRGEIQPLVDALTRAGHEVRLSGGQGSPGAGGFGSSSTGGLNATLRSADAFVVISPRSEYTLAEINGIETFAAAGGRVLMLADPVGRATSGSSTLPIPIGSSTVSTTPGQPTNLAARFGISFGSGYLYNMSENANNFRSVYARTASDGTLTVETSQTVFHDVTPLTTSEEASAVLMSEARLSSSRKEGAYAVAARTGNMTAVGDTDFLAPSTATLADNDRFVGNLASFLTTGEKPPQIPEPAASESQPSIPSIPGNGNATPPPTPGQPGNATGPNGTAP